MTPSGESNGSLSIAARCLDTTRIKECLDRRVSWPNGIRVHRVTVKRLSPSRQGGLELEFLVTLGRRGGKRSQVMTLPARHPALENPTGEQSRRARLVGHILADLFFTDEQLDMTFHSLDRDPVLTQVRPCLDTAYMSGRLGRLSWTEDAPRSDGRPLLRCTPLAYRRGRRLVLYYRDRSGRGLVGKGYADDRGRRLSRWQQDLGQHLDCQIGGLVRVPQVVHYDADLRMVLTRWAGSPTSDRRRGSFVTRARQAGEALAAIHSATLAGLKQFDEARQLRALRQWYSLLAALRPVFISQAAPLMDLLTTAQEKVSPATAAVIHGDFYESQMIFSGHNATILDLDTLATGDPCFDVGNYLAHQWLWCLKRGLPPDRYATIALTMLQSYEAAVGAVCGPTLAYHWAASLFRVGAIHAFRDGTACYVSDLWSMAEPILRQDRRALGLVIAPRRSHRRAKDGRRPDGTFRTRRRFP